MPGPDALRSFEIRVNRKVLAETLTRMAVRVPERMKTNFSAWSDYALNRFIAMRLSGPPGLRRRSGALSKSFYKRIYGEGRDTVARLASKAPYAKALEHGATIRPKTAKMLAIPIEPGPALTAAGDYRLPKGPLRQVLKAAAADTEFFSWRNPTTGKVFLLGRPKSGRGAVRAWFRLAREVALPPKLKFRRSMELYFKVLVDRLRKALREGTQGGARG